MPTSQRPAGQPKTPLAVLFALPDVPLEPIEDLDRDCAQDGVRDAAAERAEPVEAAVGALGTVAEQSTEEAPERVASETDGEDGEEQVPEGVVLDRSGALPAGS